MALDPGSRVAGRYRVLVPIARGGMGAVYEAVDERLDRRVAIKVLRREIADDPKIVARFEREALASARLQHPGIVQVLDFGEHLGSPYLVMERVAGRTLADVLTRERRMSASRAADVVEQALGALAVAHAAGIVHRDLKPANLMLVPVGVGPREIVKVLDFGLAQLKTGRGYAKLTQAGEVLGTPAFMAPEQARGAEADARTDVYAMGVVLYCLLTGVPPFPGRDPAEVVKKVLAGVVARADTVARDVPPELASIAAMAMHPDPAKRFATADAFARALSDWRERAAGRVSGRPAAPAPPRRRERSRRPPGAVAGPPIPLVALIGGGAAAVLVLIAAIVVVVVVVIPRLASSPGGQRPPPATAPIAQPPLPAPGPLSVCERAARCCEHYVADVARAPDAIGSCAQLRTLPPAAEDGCRSTLASYRGTIESLGGEIGICAE